MILIFDFFLQKKNQKSKSSLSEEAFLSFFRERCFFLFDFFAKKIKQKKASLSAPPLAARKLTYVFTAHLLNQLTTI
jgi:hypothetical protein